MLDQHAKHAANPDEKLQILRRIADIMRGTLQDPAGAAERLEEVVRLDPDDGKALGTLGEIYAALGPPRGPGARAGPAGRARRRRSGAAGRVPAAAGPAGRRASCTSSRGRAQPGSSCSDLLPTDTEALESLARIFNSRGGLAVAGPDPGAADAAGRGAGPGRRLGAAARRRSSTRSCTTPTPPRGRWSS